MPFSYSTSAFGIKFKEIIYFHSIQTIIQKRIKKINTREKESLAERRKGMKRIKSMKLLIMNFLQSSIRLSPPQPPPTPRQPTQHI